VQDGTPLTDNQIAGMGVALLMGGQHTSAATLSWSMLRLAEDTSLQERLFQEQVDVWGDGHGGLSPLTYDELQTPLLTAFVKEILRVHPPLHSLLRKVVEPIDVPTSVAAPSLEPRQPVSFRKHNEYVNYRVRAGAYVLAAPGFSAVDERVWGRDGKRFRVERWLDGSTWMLQKEEEEGQEDYGWGKISRGGKSPCSSFFPFSSSLLFSTS
jgi:sterol 14-demethylase